MRPEVAVVDEGRMGMQGLRHAITGSLLAVLVGGSAAGFAKAPGDVSDLVDARASSGESQLYARGYSLHHTSPGDDRNWGYWWNGSKKKCLSVVTMDGRYSAITEAPNSDCGHKADNNAAGVAAAVGAAAIIGAVALSINRITTTTETITATVRTKPSMNAAIVMVSTTTAIITIRAAMRIQMVMAQERRSADMKLRIGTAMRMRGDMRPIMASATWSVETMQTRTICSGPVVSPISARIRQMVPAMSGHIGMRARSSAFPYGHARDRSTMRIRSRRKIADKPMLS